MSTRARAEHALGPLNTLDIIKLCAYWESVTAFDIANNITNLQRVPDQSFVHVPVAAKYLAEIGIHERDEINNLAIALHQIEQEASKRGFTARRIQSTCAHAIHLHSRREVNLLDPNQAPADTLKAIEDDLEIIEFDRRSNQPFLTAYT